MPYAPLGTHWANSVGQSHQTTVCLEPVPGLAAVNESLPLDSSGNWIRPLLYPWDSGFTPGMKFGSLNVTSMEKESPGPGLEGFCRSLKMRPLAEIWGPEPDLLPFLGFNSFIPQFLHL